MGNFNIFSYQSLQTDENKIQVLPFHNTKIQKLAEKFHLNANEMLKFHQIFRQIDKQGCGYIVVENMFDFVEEEQTSVLSPYIIKLFQLIDKETSDRVCFLEWLPSIAAYCLFRKEQIFKFVFGIIDDDHDDNISKKDIIVFLAQEKFGKKIFYFNQVRSIELLEIERADKIDFDKFKRIQNQIPFICYPAFRLQKILKDKILGERFWEKTYKKIREFEKDEQKKKQQEVFNQQIDQKKQNKVQKKEKAFDQMYKDKKINQNIFKFKLFQQNRMNIENREYFYYKPEILEQTIKQSTDSNDVQEGFFVDTKKVINKRRLSDGMIQMQQKTQNLEFINLNYEQEKRNKSTLYIKQLFQTNKNTVMKEKIDLKLKENDYKFQFNIQSPLTPSHQNQYDNNSLQQNKEGNINNFINQLGIRKQGNKQNKQIKQIPRSLRNANKINI